MTALTARRSPRTASTARRSLRGGLREWSGRVGWAILAWAAAIMSRNGSLPSLSVVCICRSPWGAATHVGSVASAAVTCANVR